MYCRTGLQPVFTEIIAHLLQVNSRILHAPYAQVCHDFSGDSACVGHARSGPSLHWISFHGGVADIDTLSLCGSARIKTPRQPLGFLLCQLNMQDLLELRLRQ